MNPPFAASHVEAAVRRILLPQLKLRERRPLPRFIQGKKVDRPGILATRGDGEATSMPARPPATVIPVSALCLSLTFARKKYVRPDSIVMSRLLSPGNIVSAARSW